MKNELKTAKQLFQTYQKQYNDLVNIYCQVKRKRPFHQFDTLARAVWRVGVCLELWHALALKEQNKKYFEGG